MKYLVPPTDSGLDECSLFGRKVEQRLATRGRRKATASRGNAIIKDIYKGG